MVKLLEKLVSNPALRRTAAGVGTVIAISIATQVVGAEDLSTVAPMAVVTAVVQAVASYTLMKLGERVA